MDLLNLHVNEISMKMLSACFGFSYYKQSDALKAVHFLIGDLTATELNDVVINGAA